MSAQHKTITLIRHAERVDEVPGSTWGGDRWFDPPITKKGRKQARLTAQHLLQTMPHDALASIDVIYSSPYVRCLQTAGEIAAILGKPVKPVYALGSCALYSKRNDYIVDYVPHDAVHDAIHYDDGDQAIPHGTVAVESPISRLDSFESGCRDLASEHVAGTHAIFVTHREGVKDFLGVRHRIAYCGIVDCLFDAETKEFTPVKYSVGHDHH